MTTHRPRIRTAGRRTIALATASTLLLLAGAIPARAYQRPGLTDRVSVGTDGIEGDDDVWSRPASISDDGRLVAFGSFATNLVPEGGEPGVEDIFVHDRATGITEQVSVAGDGTPGDDQSWWPSMSGDGRFIAFASAATNLVPDDTNERWDVFVHDVQTGATERVSVASDGTQGANVSFWPSISPDGGFVAFVSAANNLVPGDTAFQDIFVHDRAAGTTERVSVGPGGASSNAHSRGPAISADGAFVAFHSSATNLVEGDTNGDDEAVFVHDRATGTNERVSVTSEETHVSGLGNNTWTPSISADGRFVAFTHSSSQLVQGDNGSFWDIFVRDRQAGTTERVSVASDGSQANGNSNSASISDDGRFVSFDSVASNLVPADTNGAGDVFVHDRATGATERVSVATDGAEADDWSFPATITPDGRFVAFRSIASNLVAGDRNGWNDVFVRDRGAPLGVVGSLQVTAGAGALEVSGRATISGAVVSEATDVVPDAPFPSDALGAELTGASVTYRPEQEDLLIRWRVRSLPRGPLVMGAVGGGMPAVLYAFELDANGKSYEVRALREAVTADPPSLPYAALYECAADCTEEALLTGGFGTVKHEVWVSLPLEVLGVEAGQALSSLRAVTALGEAAVGAVDELDAVALPEAGIPGARVELGVAPAGVPVSEVAFSRSAALTEGAFAAEVAGQGPGPYRVWARACLGEVCGPAAFEEVGS